MKILVVLALTFFSLQSFALNACGALFMQQGFVLEQKLNVLELAVTYHQNYLNSPEGKAQVARMEELLNTKYKLKKDSNGRPYFQIVFEPKEPVKESVLVAITSSIPNMTVVYNLNPIKKN